MIPFFAGLAVSGIALALYCCIVDGIREYERFGARWEK